MSRLTLGSQAQGQKSMLIISAQGCHCPTQPRWADCMLAQQERPVKELQQGWLPRAQLVRSSFTKSYRSPGQLLSQGESKTSQLQLIVSLLGCSASPSFLCALPSSLEVVFFLALSATGRNRYRKIVCISIMIFSFRAKTSCLPGARGC